MRSACLLKMCMFIAVVAVSQITLGQSTSSCSSPEYRQFDFWVGDWNLFEIGAATSTAHVRVDRILGGCVLHERYDDNGGLAGESFTIYDAPRKLWHQTWVTNNGRLLTIEGGRESNSIVLAGAYYRGKRQEVRVRGTWTPRETQFGRRRLRPRMVARDGRRGST